jgi:hypothetical protein
MNIYRILEKKNSRFIVQKYTDTGPYGLVHAEWTDLKEFNNLEEARDYKYELQLEDGIERE